MKIQIDKPLLKSLLQMVSIIEARDAYTGGHLWRVSQYCHLLADKAGLPEDRVFLSRIGGFLHDIGKIGVPEVILGKRGKLNFLEFEVVKTHPSIGASLVQEHPLGELVFLTVQQHHEWINGEGYPGRLVGEQISLYARIVSIADAFDALTSTRSYRPRVPVDLAVQALKAEQGTQFDRRLLDSFIDLYRSGSFEGIVGCCGQGLSIVVCPNCGPVMVVLPDTKDGDLCSCRVCGSKHRLHRSGDTFVAEPTGTACTADELRPRPDMHCVAAFAALAPDWIEL